MKPNDMKAESRMAEFCFPSTPIIPSGPNGRRTFLSKRVPRTFRHPERPSPTTARATSQDREKLPKENAPPAAVLPAIFLIASRFMIRNQFCTNRSFALETPVIPPSTNHKKGPTIRRSRVMKLGFIGLCVHGFFPVDSNSLVPNALQLFRIRSQRAETDTGFL
jgi:hypothetical protein